MFQPKHRKIVKNNSKSFNVSTCPLPEGPLTLQKTMNAMKKRRWMAALPLLAALAACEDFGLVGPQGELSWTLERDALTKASAEIPDTNDFILTITDAKGKTLYEGSYGDSPEHLQVDPGSYTLNIVSVPFTSPAFARPQYGDEQVVVVRSGQSVQVKLACRLLNAGIRLKVAPDFLTSFPDGVLYVKGGTTRLMYSYKETRIAYFKPGEVSVILYNEGKDETLFTRTLEEREILTVSISAPGNAQGSSSIQVALDTTKTWISEQFVIGGNDGGNGNGGGEETDAYSVADAAAHAGEEGVWVYGYIVGGDLTASGKTVKTKNLEKRTHLAIATRSSITDKASCVAVELPSGKVRDALNLVDHPDLIGQRVYVKGNLVESYFGTTGLKGTGDYALK